MIIVNADMVNTDEITALFRKMPKAVIEFQKAVTRRYGQMMEKEAVDEATERYYVTRGKLRKVIRVQKSAAGVKLTVRDKRHGIDEYRISPKRPPAKNRPYTIKAGVRRDGGLKPLTGLQNKPFLMASGNAYKVMMRTGAARLPIMKVESPSYAQLVKWAESHSRKIAERTEEALTADFGKYLAGLAGKGAIPQGVMKEMQGW